MPLTDICTFLSNEIMPPSRTCELYTLTYSILMFSSAKLRNAPDLEETPFTVQFIISVKFWNKLCGSRETPSNRMDLLLFYCEEVIVINPLMS